jgi:ankyrin repeat protein
VPLRKYPPTRTLRERPDLAQLKRQAKELLKAFVAGDAAAIAEVDAHYRGATAPAFTLHEAQLVLARAHGFDSWPKLKAYVDGVTVHRLVDRVRAGDVATVASMLAARPELVDLDVAEIDEHRALHHAVLQRHPEIVRLLMKYGADARKGIWPHRDATSPLTIAAERGYEEIVEIIREEENRRPTASAIDGSTSTTAELRGAGRDVRQAIATGDADWLRARYAEGALTKPDQFGLLSLAVASGRPEILTVLLELGLDPDERERLGELEEIVYSWGGPLRECAITGNTVMAAILLAHGANPNTNVYAASSAVYEAYARQDWKMVRLLETHGGIVNATTAGYLGLVDRARELLEEEAASRRAEGTVSPDHTAAAAILEGAADTGHVELVRMALAHVDWPPGDERWPWMLMRPFGRHAASERSRYVACFQMIVDRSGVDLPARFGRTLLHDVAAAWPRTAPMGPDERLAFATILLDRGASIGVRDDLLRSTPLGWACRWGRIELVALLLERGADPIEADAEPWATPRAWAQKMRHDDVLALLRTRGGNEA